MSDDIAAALHAAVRTALPGADVTVIEGSPGHFSLRVVSEVFAGKGLLAQQRLVFSAISGLMAGDMAPVHAIDKLDTLTR